jgi:hypothetical protein
MNPWAARKRQVGNNPDGQLAEVIETRGIFLILAGVDNPEGKILFAYGDEHHLMV